MTVTKGEFTMDIQKVIADAQAKADANGDGKLSVEDLDALAKEHGIDPKVLDGVKAKADANGDGRIGFEDLKSGVGQLGDMVAGLKDKLFGGK